MKKFTLEQANRTLPLVRKIVEDIVRQYAQWRERMQAFEIVTANARADMPDPRSDTLQREVQTLAAEIDGYLRELRELGIEFKGFENGLVDFPGELDGRVIYLCWQLGEPEIEHWHEIDAGFAGRQPLGPRALA